MVEELTPGTEAAIFRLDGAVRRDKSQPLCVYCCGNGNPTVKRFEADGTTTTLQLIDGAWHDVRMLP